MDDVSLLTDLYKKYKKRSTKTKNWVDYLKAHGLANACLERTDLEEWRRQVYEVERDWYGGKHPLTYPEHLKFIELSKQHLKKFRNASRSDFGSLRDECKLLDSFNTFSDDNIRRMECFTERVFELSEKCCEDFIELVREILSHSVAILDKVGMITPCPFAVIGFGSLARGEATPYSDLEYGILIQSDSAGTEYFEKLAMDSYFRIGNFGETPLKCFDIEELKTKDESGNNKFTDSLKCVGLKIDGISPKAGNIPTGNGQSGGHKLIATVDGMVQLYVNEIMAPPGDITGDLSDLLSTSVLLYSNKHGSDLHHQFRQQLIKVYQHFENFKLNRVLKKKVATLVKDIEVYNFLPNFYGSYTQRIIGNVKVKADIFRYPTLLGLNLHACFALQTSFSWETFSELKRRRILHTELKQHLQFVLAAAIYIRTSAYLTYDSQREELSFLPNFDESGTQYMRGNELYYIPSELFVIMSYILIPLKKCFHSASKAMRKRHGRQADKNYQRILKDNMSKFKIDTADYMLKAKLLRYVSDGEKALKYLITVLGEKTVYNVSNFLTRFRSKYGAHSMREMEALISCSQMLFEASRFEVSLDFCYYLLRNYQPSPSGVMVHIANCHLSLQHCDKAIQMFSKVLLNFSRKYKIGKSPQLSDYIINTLDCCYCIPTPTIQEFCIVSEVYGGLALAFAQSNTANHAENSFTCSQAAKQISTALYEQQYIDSNQARLLSLNWMQSLIYSHFAKHEFDKALAVFEDLVEIHYALYGRNTNHPEIAGRYMWIAVVLDGQNMFAKAEKYCANALAMFHAFYGEDSNHLYIANCHGNYGLILDHQGQYQESLKHRQAAVDINLAACGYQPSLILASSYNHLASAYLGLRQFDNSLNYHKKALNMRQCIFGKKSQVPEIADSISGLGTLYYHKMEYKNSLVCCMKAIEIYIIIHGTDGNHKQLATAQWNAGRAYYKLQNYEEAIKYLKLSLIMDSVLFRSTSRHRFLVERHFFLGRVCYTVALYQEALTHMFNAVEYERIACIVDFRNSLFELDDK